MNRLCIVEEFYRSLFQKNLLVTKKIEENGGEVMKLKNLLALSFVVAFITSVSIIGVVAAYHLASMGYYRAVVTIEGELTLTSDEQSYTITIPPTSFTALLPEEIEPGTYTASFEGTAKVKKHWIWFTGTLTVDGYEWDVEFKIENTFPEIIRGTYSVSGELTVTIEPK
jgi:hypothetical protein